MTDELTPADRDEFGHGLGELDGGVDFSDFGDFVDAGAAGLEAFRDVLVEHRDRIVDEPAPTFDVIVELLELCIAGARELDDARPRRCSWEAG